MQVYINQDVIYTYVEEEVVMMAPSDGAYHGLNTVGAELWKQLLEKPMSEHALGMYLKEKYAIDEQMAMQDVRAFVDAMLSKKFLITCEP